MVRHQTDSAMEGIHVPGVSSARVGFGYSESQYQPRQEPWHKPRDWVFQGFSQMDWRRTEPAPNGDKTSGFGLIRVKKQWLAWISVIHCNPGGRCGSTGCIVMPSGHFPYRVRDHYLSVCSQLLRDRIRRLHTEADRWANRYRIVTRPALTNAPLPGIIKRQHFAGCPFTTPTAWRSNREPGLYISAPH